MPGWRDFLDRFRPAGAPGAPSPGGIPVDRAAAAAAELMPLLERLDSVQDEAGRLEATAREQAAQIRRAGSEEAAALVRCARDAAETTAAQAASSESADDAATGREDDLPDDGDTAAEVSRRAGERLPEYVDQVVAGMRELIADLCAPASGTARR